MRRWRTWRENTWHRMPVPSFNIKTDQFEGKSTIQMNREKKGRDFTKKECWQNWLSLMVSIISIQDNGDYRRYRRRDTYRSVMVWNQMIFTKTLNNAQTWAVRILFIWLLPDVFPLSSALLRLLPNAVAFGTSLLETALLVCSNIAGIACWLIG